MNSIISNIGIMIIKHVIASLLGLHKEFLFTTIIQNEFVLYVCKKHICTVPILLFLCSLNN